MDTNEQKTTDTLKMAAEQFDMAGDDLKGFEDVRMDTMAVPFVRIAQKLTPQIEEDNPDQIPGLKEGDFFNTLTKDGYGKTLRCIVLKFEHIYIEWKPNRGGFVGYHDVENAERIAVDRTFGAWKTKEGNLLQENYVYMILVDGHESEGPCVLSLSSSMIKAAKEWNRLMVTHVMENGVKARPYYLIWQLTNEKRSNEKGSWFAPVIKFEGYVNERQYALTKEERLALPERRVDYAALAAPEQTQSDLASQPGY